MSKATNRHELAAKLVQIAYSFTDGKDGTRLTELPARIALFEQELAASPDAVAEPRTDRMMATDVYLIADTLRAEYPTYGAGETLSSSATLDVVRAVFAQLNYEPTILGLRRRIHFLERHNQWFER